VETNACIGRHWPWKILLGFLTSQDSMDLGIQSLEGRIWKIVA
jgi:hypothetical protein